MIFYDYLLTPQLFSYTAISRRNTVSCIKYQYRAALFVNRVDQILWKATCITVLLL